MLMCLQDNQDSQVERWLPTPLFLMVSFHFSDAVLCMLGYVVHTPKQ